MEKPPAKKVLLATPQTLLVSVRHLAGGVVHPKLGRIYGRRDNRNRVGLDHDCPEPHPSLSANIGVGWPSSKQISDLTCGPDRIRGRSRLILACEQVIQAIPLQFNETLGNCSSSDRTAVWGNSFLISVKQPLSLQAMTTACRHHRTML